MFTKQLFAVLLSALGINSFAFDLFGPKSFEECLSKELQGVNSDDAAKMILYSCRERFPKDSEKSKNEFDSDGLRVCRIIWTGVKFEKGSLSKVSGFARYSITHENSIKYVADIPAAMAKDFEKKGLEVPLVELLSRNLTQARIACGIL